MEVDQTEALKRLHDKQMNLSDDRLNDECDRVSPF